MKKMSVLRCLLGVALGCLISSVSFSHIAIERMTSERPVKQLLVIDEAVSDKDLLVSATKSGIDVRTIKSDQDGVTQLRSILADYKALETLHIVSHASDGRLSIGNGHINKASFETTSFILESLEGALSENGDLLFYGCDLASGQKGRDLLSYVAEQTGLNIAASTNPTGDKTKNADWDLEWHIGRPDSPLAFNLSALKDYQHILPAPSISIDASNLAYTEDDPVTQVDAAATLSDADGDADWDGGTLVVQITANNEAADEISIPDNIVGNINTDGTDLRDSTTVIGTLSASEGTVTDGTALTITFDSDATNTLVQQVVRAIHYRNTSNDPGTGNRTVTFTATDTNTESANDTRTITVAAANDAPTDISLSSNTIGQTATSAGADVGTLSSTDDDDSSFTYSIVSQGSAANGDCGSGNDADNANFQINSTTLETSASLTIGTYNICLQTDDGDTTFEESLTITVSDDIAPSITSVTLPADGTYNGGDAVNFTVNFDENVDVSLLSGTPRLTLTIGSITRYASYQSGGGSSTLLFTYTVLSGDNDSDGISASTTLDLNGGTIEDASDNSTGTNLGTLGSLAAVLVDTIRPTVSEVTAVVTPSSDNTPSVTVNTDEAGALAVGGSCGSSDEGPVSAGNHTITLTQADNSSGLNDSTYNDCSVVVTDEGGNVSTAVNLTAFVIDSAPPNIDINAGQTVDEGTSVTINNSRLRSNDSSSGAENVTYTLITTTSNGVLSNNGANLSDGGTFTQDDIDSSLFSYSHDGSETDRDSFVFTVQDQSGNVNDDSGNNITFNITVNLVNDVPVANTDSETTNEDTPFDISVLTNDTDADDGLDATTVTIISDVSNGSTSVNTLTGVVTYTPAAEYSGSDSFTYTVDDNSGATSNTATVNITVNAVNDPPSTVNDTSNTVEENAIVISVLDNDSDVDSSIDASTVSIVSDASNGSTSVNPTTGAVTYTPDTNFNSTDSFTYTVEDTDGLVSASATVTINVSNTSDNPIATDDASVTNEDNAIQVDVLANDNDPDDTGPSSINAASVTVITDASNGSTSVNTASGVITYTPDADFNGNDSFTYTVQDVDSNTSNIATVNITVVAQNDAPVAIADVVGTDIGVPVTIDAVANDTDVDSGDAPDGTTLVVITNVLNGTLSIESGEFLYTPGMGFIGTDNFSYTVNDSNGATSNAATVTISVVDPNDQPVANDDAVTIQEDNAVMIDVLDNDSDSDGSLDATSVTVVTPASNGSTSVNSTTGVITYTPNDDFNGTDTFTYTVQDDLSATSNAATVTVTVQSVNDAPVAENDTVNLIEDNSLSINVLGNDNDVDGSLDTRTVTIVARPGAGSVDVNATTGIVIYTPELNFSGGDSFTYRVSDNDGLESNVAAVTLAINAENDPPLANGDEGSLLVLGTITVDVLSNDSDVDSNIDPSTVTIVTTPGLGSAMVDSNGAIVYTAGNTGGEDTLTYRVSDEESGQSNVATVTITVIEPALPVLSGTPASMVEEPNGYSFTPEVTLYEGLTATFSATNLPAWASFNTVTGQLSGTTSADDVGVYENIIISVNDGYNTVSLASFSIEVLSGVDTDGDSISDAQEAIDGTDPLNPEDYFDITPPDLTPPTEIILDATALYTPVSLAQLLGLSSDAAQAEIDQALGMLVSDNVDGDACCNPTVIGMEDGQVLLPPGRIEVRWLAEDRMANTTQEIQYVHVRPFVSFGKNRTAVEGERVIMPIILSGLAPSYPFQVPYIIDVDDSSIDLTPASTGSPNSDHDFAEGIAVFNEGETEVEIVINLVSDQVAERDELLIVELDDRTTNDQDLSEGFNADMFDINAGVSSRYRLRVVERNVAPSASLSVMQDGVQTIQITNDGGMVDVTATVTDGNPGDSFAEGGLTADWLRTDAALVDTDGAPGNTVFSFDPSSLAAGSYMVALQVSDDQGLSDIVSVHLVVVASLPALLPDQDTDGDGVSDEDEGTADSDNDGIADYLDNISQTNVLPEQVENSDSFLIECEPGLRCRLGEFAVESNDGGAHIDDDDIAANDAITEDEEYDPVGGIFDFEIQELQESGQEVRVVLPQLVSIPAEAVYRKFLNGQWQDFVIDEDNRLHSAPGSLGFCPPPGDESWQLGLIEGFFCVQLTLEDGGPNDSDGEVNSSVADPGAVAVRRILTENTGVRFSASGGGSFDMWSLLVLSVIGLALWVRRCRMSLLAASMVFWVLPTEDAFAEKEAGPGYQSFLEFDLMLLDSSVSESDFVEGMASYGLSVSVNAYDVQRPGYQLSWGVEFNPLMTLIIGYADLGSIDVEFNVELGQDTPLTAALENNYPLTADGFTFSYRLRHEIIEKVNLMADVGIFLWDADVGANVAGVDLDNAHGEDLTFSLAGEYTITPHFIAQLKYRHFVLNEQSSQGVSLGLRYKF